MESETAVTEQLSYVTLAEGTIASDYALKNLNKALGEAQVEFGPAVKAEENTYGGYKYTPLIAIVGAVRPSLTKHHLTVSQFPVINLETKVIALYTRLVHWDSGEWIQNMMELPAELALGKGGTPVFNQQTIGGSQTYAQKYAYKAIIGIPDSEEMIDSTEEKGDLPARSKGQASPPSRPPAPPKASPGPFSLNGDVLHCVVRSVQEKETGAKKKYLAVVFNGYLHTFNFATCFDTGLYEALAESVGKECHLKLKEFKDGDKFLNIVDVLAIGTVDYVDGKPASTAGEMAGE